MGDLLKRYWIWFKETTKKISVGYTDLLVENLNWRDFPTHIYKFIKK